MLTYYCSLTVTMAPTNKSHIMHVFWMCVCVCVYLGVCLYILEEQGGISWGVGSHRGKIQAFCSHHVRDETGGVVDLHVCMGKITCVRVRLNEKRVNMI